MIHYYQKDIRWGEERLGHGYEGVTIGHFGSFLVCLSDVISNYGHVINPLELNDKLKSLSSFSSGLINPYSVEELFPIKVKVLVPSNVIRTATQIIDEMLEAGRLVIAQINESWLQGYQGLWVVIYKKEKDDYLVLDPYKGEVGNFLLRELYPYAGPTTESAIFQLIMIEPDNFFVEVDPIEYLGKDLESVPFDK